MVGFDQLRVDPALLDQLEQAVFVVSQQGIILAANQSAFDIYGYPEDRLIGMDIRELRSPNTEPDVDYQLSIAHTSGITFETEHVTVSGTLIPVEVRAIPFMSDGSPTILSVVSDISEKKADQDRIQRLQRLYRVLSGVNQALVQLRNPSDIFNKTCEVIVNEGDLEMVWIGITANDDVTVEPVAHCGKAKDYVDSIIIKLNDPIWGIGPIGQSITKNTHVICHDISTNPMMEPWRNQALAYNFQSNAAFPLRLNGKPVGALNIYSSLPDYFGEEEIELLDTLAENISLVLDLSERENQRRRAESNLRDSEHWLSESQKIAELGHYVYDIAEDEWVGSESLYTVLGVDTDYRRDLAGWLNTVHPDFRESMSDYFINHVVGNKQPFDIEYPVLRPSDGTYHWVHGLGTLEFDDEGNPIRMFGIIQDISRKKQTEIDLRESEYRYSLLAEQSGTIAWEVDTEGLYTYISPVVKTVLGYEPEEVVGKMHFYDLHPPKGQEEFKEYAFEIIKQKGHFHDYPNPALAKNGKLVWLSTDGVPFHDQQGNFAGYRGIDNDITLQREHEQRLNELLAERESHLERLAQSLNSTVDVLVRVCEERDPYTAGHQRRVSQLAEAIARELNMSSEDIHDIALAGKVHDVGKISVPAEILTKPRGLNDIEYEMVRSHAQKSFEIVSQANMPGPIAALVHQHHERGDGSGYPQGLTMDEILEGARVIIVADVVEAMASHRPYRAAVGIDAALEEIQKGAGVLYAIEPVKACVDLITSGRFEFLDDSDLVY